MSVQLGFVIACVVALLYVFRAKVGMFLLGSAVKTAAPAVVREVESVAPVVEIGESEARRMRINSAAEQLQKIAVMASTPIQSHTIAAAVPHPATVPPPAPEPAAPK